MVFEARMHCSANKNRWNRGWEPLVDGWEWLTMMVNDGLWWHHLSESVVNNDDLPLKSWVCSIIDAQKLAGTLESESNDMKNQEEPAFYNAPEDHFRYQFPHHFGFRSDLGAAWPLDPLATKRPWGAQRTNSKCEAQPMILIPFGASKNRVDGTNAGCSSFMCQT